MIEKIEDFLNECLMCFLWFTYAIAIGIILLKIKFFEKKDEKIDSERQK